MGDVAEAALALLAELWRLERETARREQRRLRQALDLRERVERGLALKGLVLDDTDATAGGRVLLWLKLEPNSTLEGSRIGSGDPVLLWAGAPEGEQTEQGVVARVEKRRVAVAVEPEYGDFIEHASLNLEREAPEATFVRGEQAIARLRSAARGSELERLRETLLGDRALETSTIALTDEDFVDRELDATQRAAVRHALRAKDVALIHGPPGTGKTRTLVEVVRQSLRRGERVLVSAASNAAVDNLGERLSELGVPVLRLGHPARVSPALESRTLDALVEDSAARARARRFVAEANEMRRRVERRRARERLGFREARELMREARALMRDARRTLDAERSAQLERARVVCATAAGVEVAALEGRLFDLVVLDEATQAVDPLALAALSRGKRAVLAGDPRQLPPTVLDPDAAQRGLGRTLFERLLERHGQMALAMLQVQYRMHAELMRFPSHSMYDGKLIAADQVARRMLEELPGVRADTLRPGPWHFIDTSGKGFVEQRSEDDPSTCNPAQAERTARDVRRLLSRGLAPTDLAVITPYLAQARLLREALRDAIDAGLECGTVDAFQGREKQAVVVDLVRSNDDGQVGFLADTRRMNVALTRAMRFLLVIGDAATLQRHPYYQSFMDAAEAGGAHLSAWADDADLI